jgi:tetratricopeptide (TPR) repeat protein
MDDDQQDRIRPRREEAGSGLTRDARGSRTRPSGQGLVVEKLADAATAGSLQLISIADQLMPACGADIDTAAAGADFGIASLLAEQKSGRARALVEKARQLMAAKQWRPALGVVQQARVCDPSSTEVVLLQLQCLVELGHFELALRVVSHVRDHVVDPEVRSLILRREATCIRATTKELEGRLIALAGQGNLEGALQLVEEGLARQPSNIVFLCQRAKLHYLRSELDAARLAIEEARRHVGRESTDVLAELERLLDFGPHAAAIEAGRQALRKGDAAAALRALDSCAEALAGNEHYEGLRDYAHELRPGALALVRKSKPVAVGGALRQQTLRWLLAEEIQRGGDALREGRYARAEEAYSDAGRIEPRCGAVCFNHAQALFLKHDRRPGGRPSPAGDVQQDLANAEALVERAMVDAGFREQAEALTQAIRGLRQRLGLPQSS